MRIFLSFNTLDQALAEAIRAGLLKLEPKADIFFSPVSLGQGFWLPKLSEGIRSADAFLLLLGPRGVGPWQEVEYHEAFDRHVQDPRFSLVPVIVGAGHAPGLPFLRRLNWVETSEAADDKGMHRVLAALKGDAGPTLSPLWKLVHPYRGLKAMTEANADYFYGRTAETEAVLTLMVDKPGRLPILIGASGVGKSSIARAGVLSTLKAMRWPDQGDGAANPRPWPEAFRNSRNSWAWLVVRPGDDPFYALAAAFTRLWLKNPTDPDRGPLARKWADGLRGANTLADLLDATQEQLNARDGAKPERILVYLDQGEELYTRAARTALKNVRRFSDVLAEGLRDPRLIAFGSLRADYFDRLQGDAPLFAAHEHVNVQPLTRAQLEQVVSAPANALGVAFEDDRLPNRLIDAAAEKPGALPLLSYLLTDIWSGMVERSDGTLRLPMQVIDIGGVLAARAEEFLKARPAVAPWLKRLLTLKLALVPPEGDPLRRQARRSECTTEEWTLAEQLAEHPWRLVVIDERNGEVMAEVAHEALLRAWPRLDGWLRDEREFLVFKSEVERTERRWREMNCADRALLTGFDLARAEEWWPKRLHELSTEIGDFIQASIALDRATKARLQRRVSIGAVLAPLLMAAVGGTAAWKWRDADAQRNLAEMIRRHAKQEAEVVRMLVGQIEKGSKATDLFRQIRKAAEAGNPRAMHMLGRFYYRGLGEAQDFVKAREWFERAAEKGDESAMHNLGVLYTNGEGVPQNYNKAHEWYEKAAEKGAAAAMYNLGLLYANGQGVPQDDANARAWFEKAAEQGDAIVMTSLGGLYADARGVPEDYAKARELFEKAAEQGNAVAMRKLGGLYRNGQGVPQDYAKAREWFEKAAEQGDADAR